MARKRKPKKDKEAEVQAKEVAEVADVADEAIPDGMVNSVSDAEKVSELLKSIDAEPITDQDLASVIEQPKQGASLESFGLAPRIILVEEVKPQQENESVHRWDKKRGDEIGPLTHRFASISVREERETSIPLDNNIMYIVEWKFEGGDYPVASVPSRVADVLRRAADARRKYAEL